MLFKKLPRSAHRGAKSEGERQTEDLREAASRPARLDASQTW